MVAGKKLWLSDSESDESDPRFKYPNELAEDTEFLVELRVYDDSLTCEAYDTKCFYTIQYVSSCSSWR